MTITCGIDWAEKHHDVTLVGDDGHIIVTGLSVPTRQASLR